MRPISRPVLALALALLPRSLAILVNFTVDDADLTQVTYQPPTSWHASTVSCASCFHPDTSLAIGGTFHDGTGGLQDLQRAEFSDGKDDDGNDNDNDDDDRNPNIDDGPTVTATIAFTGVAIYVYCIVPDANDGNHLFVSNLTFTLDGSLVGSFMHNPPAAKTLTYLYDKLVFNQTGLDHSTHELVITAPPSSVLLFDYARYLADPASEDATGTLAAAATSTDVATDQKNQNTVSFGIAVGASVGTLSVVVIVLCISLQWRRRAYARRLRAERDAEQNNAAFVPRFFRDVDAARSEPPATRFVARYFTASDHGYTNDANSSPAYSPPPTTSLLPHTLPPITPDLEELPTYAVAAASDLPHEVPPLIVTGPPLAPLRSPPPPSPV